MLGKNGRTLRLTRMEFSFFSMHYTEEYFMEAGVSAVYNTAI